MGSEAGMAQTSRSLRVLGGVWGRWVRWLWRRTARRMNESQIDELRKRNVIVTRQLDGLPFSSRVQKRRRELLRDRERCEALIAEWERLHELGKAS